jgi:hypothetical protein
MMMPRRHLVDVEVTRYYHFVFRCVRQAIFCGEGVTLREAGIEARLILLANHFATCVCGFPILDNQLRVLCRLRAGFAAGLSDEVFGWAESTAILPPRLFQKRLLSEK